MRLEAISLTLCKILEFLMTKSNDPTRRDFIRQVSAGAMAAASAGSTLSGEGVTRQAPAVSKGRVLGANDRINVGFVGCGGRMNATSGM